MFGKSNFFQKIYVFIFFLAIIASYQISASLLLFTLLVLLGKNIVKFSRDILVIKNVVFFYSCKDFFINNKTFVFAMSSFVFYVFANGYLINSVFIHDYLLIFLFIFFTYVTYSLQKQEFIKISFLQKLLISLLIFFLFLVIALQFVCHYNYSLFELIGKKSFYSFAKSIAIFGMLLFVFFDSNRKTLFLYIILCSLIMFLLPLDINIICLVVGLVGAFIFTITRKFKITLIVLSSIIIIGIVCIYLLFLINSQLLENILPLSWFHRLYIWQYTLIHIKENIFFGNGILYPEYLSENAPKFIYDIDNVGLTLFQSHAHNVFLHMVLQIGLFGLSLFILNLVFFAKYCFNTLTFAGQRAFVYICFYMLPLCLTEIAFLRFYRLTFICIVFVLIFKFYKKND